MDIELKHKTIHELIRSEIDYINELFTFDKLYTSKLKYWLDNTAADTKTAIKRDLELLLYHLHCIAIAHTQFIKRLRNR